MSAGIYSFTDQKGRRYIGTSVNIEKRRYTHLNALRNGSHANQFLQRIFDKYGEAGLEHNVLLICDARDVIYFEQRAIDTLKPELNLAQVAGAPMAGRCHSAEARKKMSAAHAGKKRPNYPKTRKPHSEETKSSIRKALGRTIVNVELGLKFPSAIEAAEWCIEQGLTTSIECRKNINRAIRLKTPTVFG